MDFFLVVFGCIFIHFGRRKKIMKKSMEKFMEESRVKFRLGIRR